MTRKARQWKCEVWNKTINYKKKIVRHKKVTVRLSSFHVVNVRKISNLYISCVFHMLTLTIQP